MLPVAALILSDPDGVRVGGVDLNERAALVAHEAGIRNIYFTGARVPDLISMVRLHTRGIAASALPGWPRLFATVPEARWLVVLSARTMIEPAAIVAMMHEAASNLHTPALAVRVGGERKDALLRSAAGIVTSVMGDGNATSLGVAIVPGELLPRLRRVWSMPDAIHRLAKTGELRAFSTEPFFCRAIDLDDDLGAIERRLQHHLLRSGVRGIVDRLLRLPALVWPGARLEPIR